MAISETIICWEIQHILTKICIHMNRKVHVTCNFNCFIETEGLVKVTYTIQLLISRKLCKMKIVLLQITNRKWYTNYRIAAVLMTSRVIHLLQDDSNVIFHAVVQQLIIFQLTQNAVQSICNSWDSSAIVLCCCHQQVICMQVCCCFFWSQGKEWWRLCCNLMRSNIFYSFLGNVKKFAIACPSVCRLSVTLVRPTQAVEIFGSISMTSDILAIRWRPHKILRRSSQGTPPSGRLNARGVAKYSNFGPIEGYISETVQARR